jgi:glc operon protein GlcG
MENSSLFRRLREFSAAKECPVTEENSMSLHLAFASVLWPALIVFAMASLAQMPYGAPISIEDAKKAAAAALVEARKNSWIMAVAIVDTAGNLVYFERMDHTQVGSIRVAMNKARSAVLYKRPTKALQDTLASGGAGVRVLRLEEAIPVEGGVPLVAQGAIIGAIGVSGDTSEHDGQCANAGATTVK